MKAIKQTLGAIVQSLCFLTRLPLPTYFLNSTKNTGEVVHFFPIAGLVIGALSAVTLVCFHLLGQTSLITAICVVITQVLVTGALHEDGLADVADALFVQRERQDRLKIMKDPRLGVYGVLALLFIVSLRIALVQELLTRYSLAASATVLMTVECLSRSVMVYFWARSPLARATGTLVAIGRPTLWHAHWALFTGMLLFLIGNLYFFGVVRWIIPVLLGIAVYTWFSSLCLKTFGGITGDTLGAMQQLLVVTLLFGMTIT